MLLFFLSSLLLPFVLQHTLKEYGFARFFFSRKRTHFSVYNTPWPPQRLNLVSVQGCVLRIIVKVSNRLLQTEYIKPAFQFLQHFVVFIDVFIQCFNLVLSFFYYEPYFLLFIKSLSEFFNPNQKNHPYFHEVEQTQNGLTLDNDDFVEKSHQQVEYLYHLLALHKSLDSEDDFRQSCRNVCQCHSLSPSKGNTHPDECPSISYDVNP